MENKKQKTSGKHVTYIYQFIIKDSDEQPDEEVHRLGPEGSQAQEFVSRGVGVCYSPSTWMCSPTQKLPESCYLGFYGDSITQTQLIKSLAIGD